MLGRLAHSESLRAVAPAFLITRAVILLVNLLSLTAMPSRYGSDYQALPSVLPLDGLVRWDSFWYTGIAGSGYSYTPGAQSTVAFFPLYPLSINLVTFGTGNAYIAGLLVSNVAFIAALFMLYRLVRDSDGAPTAGRTVFYLAAAPTAFFFSALYSESLFLALAVACLWSARRGQWLWAGLFGALAAATRSTGVVLAAALAIEGLQQSGALSRVSSAPLTKRVISSWPAVVAAAIVPLGIVAYAGYLGVTLGNPWSFIEAQAAWGRGAGLDGILRLVPNTMNELRIGSGMLAGQFSAATAIDLLFTLVAGASLVVSVFTVRPSYVVYALGTFLIPLASGTVLSMSRFSLVLFPCFIVLARLGERPWFDRLYLGLALPLLGYLTVVFSHWYFAG